MDSSITIIMIILGIVAIVFFYASYLIAKEFYNIAILKGYRDKKYFWYCFFFSILGILLVIALPNKSNKTQKRIDNLPEL